MSVANEVTEMAYKAEMERCEKDMYNIYRQDGTISEFVLVAHPKLRGNLENALYALGLDKIPILYTKCCERNKVYAVTDKDVVKRHKSITCFKPVKAQKDLGKCGSCKYYKPYVINGKEVRRGACAKHGKQSYHDATQKACKKYEVKE